MAFRVMSGGTVRVRITIYDHTLVAIKTLEMKGDGVFDLLWEFNRLPEGIYYYQADVVDLDTNLRHKVKLQKFVVLRGGEGL